ncbi:PEP-CTERM sorting domain-containing protein [Thalassotalea atypica]|uniref:PEP-CTERM sorting domain-containing protein n=1 Tax=Thalassotalea atypica TaxID=2054316 RepID=UPI0025738E22|nr:PEP-CTERM sorting domain-containing protein [Thalassotalea atypica]
MIKRLLVLSGFIFSINANANLLVNGNFDEVGNVGEYAGEVIYAAQNPNPTLDKLNADSFFNWGLFSEIPSWQTLPLSDHDGLVEVLHTGANVGVVAHSGDLFLEFDLDDDGFQYNGAIGQTVMGLTVGNSYRLSFYYQPRTDTAGDNDVNIHAFEGDLSGFDATQNIVTSASSDRVAWQNVEGKDANGWKQYSVKFTATSDTMSIAFAGAGNVNGQGGFIDSADLTQIPEPAYIFALGLAIMGMSRLRKQK